MARLGRYFVAGQPLHVIQRGNNRKAIFFADEDYSQYRDWLAEAAEEYGCAVHAYVLMPNHVHLLVTPKRKESLPRLMQSLGRRYVRYINFSRGRSGTLWEGRYRAAPIDAEDHFLACCRYIETNPVRARLARGPREYRWSSYAAHAYGKPDPLAADHPLFKKLGRTGAARQAEYRALCREALAKDFVAALRAATNGGWALGDERFRRRIAKAAKRRAAPLPRGRAPKADPDKKR
jgi:putative transposase